MALAVETQAQRMNARELAMVLWESMDFRMRMEVRSAGQALDEVMDKNG